ncbi:Holliday junction resolvase RuvX [Nitratifractor sp.]
MIAAVDVGLRRIGLALSPDGKVVIPQRAIERKGRNQAAAELSRFLREWEVDTLVVGIPIGGSSEEEMGRRIRHFVGLVDLPDGVTVHYQDESFSSREVKERTAGEIRHKRDGRIDSMAAQVILQRWLDGQANGV